MSNYRFYIEKNKYIWENGTIKLEFSKPSILADDDYNLISKKEEIMYFYYQIKVFYMQEKYIDNPDSEDGYDIVNVWKLLVNRATYDFPCIKQLIWMLEEALNYSGPVTDGQKVVYSNGKTRYMFNYFTEGFGCDDFYQITKIVDEKENKDFWILYIGGSFDPQGDENSIGVRTPYIKREDVEELLKCAKSFVEYAMNIHNDKIYKSLQKSITSYEIKNNKLYYYRDKNIIGSIFIEGDTVDVVCLKDKTFTECSEHFYSIKIKKIHDNFITFDNGEEVEVSLIGHMFYEVNNDILQYNMDECVNEVINILSPDGIKDFTHKEIKYLVKKYGEALSGRVWLYREEHNILNPSNSNESLLELFILNVSQKIKNN